MRLQPLRLQIVAAIAPLLVLAACGGMPQNAESGIGGPGRGMGDELAVMPPPGPVTEPARLKGLNPMQVRAVLGRPVFTRRDNPAEIWQYRARACTLDLFIYDEKNGQTVSHYAVRSPSHVPEQECFQELLAKSRGVPAG
ncbi:MAG: hypothetical protein ACM33T_06960 [Solirubrobacterales bacterium]